jgi:hypothetical protein
MFWERSVMASILFSPGNLRAYSAKAGVRQNFPNWPLDELLYLSIPVLAIRNLDFDLAKGDEKYWALSWKGTKNQSIAFGVTGSILRRWQAFRPHPSRKLLQKIEKRMPSIVRRFQRQMRQRQIRTIRDVKPNSPAYHIAVMEMAKAVADLSQVKSRKARNPMMGSKILHFLYPEFFPVWDTYWIKKKVLNRYFKERHKNLPKNVQTLLGKLKFSKGSAYYSSAREYASYVHLMLIELSKISERQYRRLLKECINKAEIGHEVIDCHFHCRDMSPILFETCLLGKYC